MTSNKSSARVVLSGMGITGIRADGTEFPAAISARVIDYRSEEVVVSSMVDVSDELAMRDELARQKDPALLAEKMSALGELLAGVAHGLNNPLSIVVGNAHMLLEEDDDPARLRRSGKLGDAAEPCVRIVRTFLSMTQDRSLELTTVSAEAVVSAAANAYREGDHTADLEIAVLRDHALPALRIDETQTVQVLTNLPMNADHAIGASRRDGRIEIGAQSSKKAGFATITVADNRPGVPPEIASRIYDPLFTTRSEGQGIGVGFAICQRIVASHGGTITLDQTHQPGACFVIQSSAALTDQDVGS